MGLVKKPVANTFLTLITWAFARQFIPEIKEDESLIRTTISTLSTFWGILAAFIFTRVWSQWSEIEKARRGKDFDSFLRNKDSRLPKTGKDLLKLLSYLLLGAFFLLSFKNFFAGIYTISSIAFVLSLYTAVIEDLDDPLTGVWNIGELPEEWKEKLKTAEFKKAAP